MQTLIVYIIFSLALVYAGWKIYQLFRHKPKAGCSKCENPMVTPTITALKKN